MHPADPATFFADVERLALELVAVVGLGAVLAFLANTAAYPLVVGSELVALVYMAGQGMLSGQGLATFLRRYLP
jgi:hypothetical protein